MGASGLPPGGGPASEAFDLGAPVVLDLGPVGAQVGAPPLVASAVSLVASAGRQGGGGAAPPASAGEDWTGLQQQRQQRQQQGSARPPPRLGQVGRQAKAPKGAAARGLGGGTGEAKAQLPCTPPGPTPHQSPQLAGCPLTSVEVHHAFLLAQLAGMAEGLSPSARAQVLKTGTALFVAGVRGGQRGGSAMQTLPQAPVAAERQRWAKGLLLGRPREPD